jgi:hypothetical protein
MTFHHAVTRGACAILLIAVSSCSIADPTPKGLSAFEAETIASQISDALANGVSGAYASPAMLGAKRASAANRASSVPVNVQLSGRTNCTSGGYINVSGAMTGSISDNGTGALLLQMTETVNDWACIGDLVVNGDPYISVTGTFSFLSANLSSPATMSIGGGFRWTGSSSGTCGIRLTVLMYANGSGHTSGQVCDRGVDVTY